MNKRLLIYIAFAIVSCISWTLSLDSSYRERAIEISRYWKDSDHMSPNGGHLVERFTSFQNTVSTSSYIKGVAIFDSTNSMIAKYPDGVIEPDFARGITHPARDISILRSGFFVYDTYFVVDSTYLFVAHFYDESSIRIFLSFNLLVLTILIVSILIEHRYNIKALDDYCSSSIARAHELNSPLTLANTLAETLLTDNTVQAKIYACHFLKYYKIAYNLQKDMLTLDAKAEINDPKSLDIGEVVRSFFEAYQSDISHLNVVRKFSHTRSIFGDEAKLFSVVSNIVRNALQHTDHLVIVQTEDIDNYVVLRVINSGHGIPRHALKKIFKPLYRLSKTGTGMGLYITDKYVRLHGGKITVRSSGGMTEFAVFIPSCALDQMAPRPHQDSSKIHIAVLDDEEFNNDIVRSKLAKLDACITFFTQESRLLKALNQAQNFDAILVDRYLPGGFDAVRGNFVSNLRRNFGVKGAICLYSNSKFNDSTPAGFDFAFHKSQALDPLIKHLQRRS